VTLNEPVSYTINGYHGGTSPPARCSKYVGNCSTGDSTTEPYIVAHHFILSHAAAAKLYKAKYQVLWPKSLLVKMHIVNQMRDMLLKMYL